MSSLTWHLYVIIDRQACGLRDPVETAACAIRGGADIIQLRDKTSADSAVAETAAKLIELTRAAGIPLILNDRVAVAAAVGVDGVHVGQQDWPVERVRQAVGSRMLVGKSTHSIVQALAAQKEGADYIGFGPLFATPTKPDYGFIGTASIRQVMAQLSIPVVCIGGVDLNTIDAVVRAGAGCVAVVRAVCAAQQPQEAARLLKERLLQINRAIPLR